MSQPNRPGLVLDPRYPGVEVDRAAGPGNVGRVGLGDGDEVHGRRAQAAAGEPARLATRSTISPMILLMSKSLGV